MNTPAAPHINNFYTDTNFRLRNVRKIKALLLELFRQEKKILSRLSCVFCSDEYLLGINQKHLNHDFYTDIITFDLSEDSQIVAELYISTDRVKDNSIQYNSPFLKEIYRVMIHGALHLCGYSDKTSLQQQKMRTREDYYLQILERST